MKRVAKHNLGPWVIIRDMEALNVALTLARGKRQRELLLGWETYSGSTAKERGVDSTFRKLYQKGHDALLERLRLAGVEWTFEPAGPRTVVRTVFQEQFLTIEFARCMVHEDCLLVPELGRACREKTLHTLQTSQVAP
jgi:hypothetical protein